MLAFKVLELGYSQAKKHKAKKQAKQQQQQQFQQPPYPTGQPYPMAEYPPNVAPGADVQFPPPASAAANEPTSKRAKLASMFISGVRFLQFVFGLTVIGLYGRDVHHDHAHKDVWHAKWVYALIAAFLATVTAAVHMALPFCMRRISYRPSPALKLPQFLWEFVLCVLWLTLFGIFGKMYIGVHPAEKESKRDELSALGDAEKINRMRHAVWIDLINLVMWVVTASWVLLRWLKGRRAATIGDAEKL